MKLHQPHSQGARIFSVRPSLSLQTPEVENPEVHSETKGSIPLLKKEMRFKDKGFHETVILYEHKGKHHLGITPEFLCSMLHPFVF